MQPIRPSSTVSRLGVVVLVTSSMSIGVGGGALHSAGANNARRGLLCFLTETSALRIHSSFVCSAIPSSAAGPSAPLCADDDDDAEDDSLPSRQVHRSRWCRRQPGSLATHRDLGVTSWPGYSFPRMTTACREPGTTTVRRNVLRALDEHGRRNVLAQMHTSASRSPCSRRTPPPPPERRWHVPHQDTFAHPAIELQRVRSLPFRRRFVRNRRSEGYEPSAARMSVRQFVGSPPVWFYASVGVPRDTVATQRL